MNLLDWESFNVVLLAMPFATTSHAAMPLATTSDALVTSSVQSLLEVRPGAPNVASFVAAPVPSRSGSWLALVLKETMVSRLLGPVGLSVDWFASVASGWPLARLSATSL